MNCLICRHGDTERGRATVILQRETCTVIFKDVPAQVCKDCGEYYLTQEISADLFQRAEEAVRRGAEVEILHYAA